MASTCDIYKGSTILGSGTCAAGSATISSYTPFNAGLSGDITRLSIRRNVQVVITQAGTHQGRSWNTHVLSGSSGVRTLRDACPFVGA